MAMRTETAEGREGFDSAQTGVSELQLTPDESRAEPDGGSFESDDYAVVRGIFDRLSSDVYATYALMLRAGKRFKQGEESGFLDLYGDTLTESMLLRLKPAMEQATGLKLLSTYSYLRIYETGAALARHTDRDACEISASLTVWCDAPEPWPLWLESRGRQRPVTLLPGDMVVYRGREVPHWRERFGGRYWIQAFFHYVAADGPFASHKFDGRRAVGFPRD